MIVALLTLFGGGLLFGARSWLHKKRTGSAGFLGVSGTPGSLAWWGGVGFGAASVLALFAPLLVVAGIDRLLYAPARPLDVAGGAAGALGVVLTWWSQSTMGRSWRIGVRETERTELVTGGPFRWVRNPIFTSMILALLGVFLLLPSVGMLAALVAMIAAVELQVRAVEEPYLIRAHGDRYLDYASRAGRFVPGIGRLGRAGPLGAAERP